MNNKNQKPLESCSFCEKAMKYAYIDLTENHRALIDAEEMSFFDALLEKAKNNPDIEIDEQSEENVSYKLVYGGLLVNERLTSTEEAIQTAMEMAGFHFAHITENAATLCRYKEIMFFENKKASEMGIPFAAIMKIPLDLNNSNCSVTLTPLFQGHNNMWEQMVNRPFLLACRLEEYITERENEDFVSLINTELLQEAFDRAFIVEGVEDEE